MSCSVATGLLCLAFVPALLQRLADAEAEFAELAGEYKTIEDSAWRKVAGLKSAQFQVRIILSIHGWGLTSSAVRNYRAFPVHFSMLSRLEGSLDPQIPPLYGPETRKHPHLPSEGFTHPTLFPARPGKAGAVLLRGRWGRPLRRLPLRRGEELPSGAARTARFGRRAFVCKTGPL